MCFRTSSHVASVCLSGGMIFTIMGKGSPISASHAATTLCRHVWKEMRLKTMATSCILCIGVPQERWSDGLSPWQVAFQKPEIWRSMGVDVIFRVWGPISWLLTNVGNNAGKMRGGRTHSNNCRGTNPICVTWHLRCILAGRLATQLDVDSLFILMNINDKCGIQLERGKTGIILACQEFRG